MGVAQWSVSTSVPGLSSMWWQSNSSGRGVPAGLVVFATVLSAFAANVEATDCKLLGKGACRGEGWSEGVWPVSLGKQSLENCCEKCGEKEGCTGLSLSKEGECFLFGHEKIVPASALGGECYSFSKSGGEDEKKSPPARKVEEKQQKVIQEVKEKEKAPEKKKEKQPEIKKKEEKVDNDDDDDDDDDDDKDEKSKKQKKDDNEKKKSKSHTRSKGKGK